MKGILLYAIPILTVILLHMFGFTSDAVSTDKAEPTLQAGNSNGDGASRDSEKTND
jgi:hypothetical protein